MGKEKRHKKQKKAGNGGIFGIAYGLADKRDLPILAVENVILSVACAWIFYDSPIALISIVPISILNARRYYDNKRIEFERRFMNEYKELLLGLVNALETGYSVENAFADAENNLRSMYGKNGVLSERIHALNARVSLKMPVEQAFARLAEEYPYEEVVSFANIFSFAKRLGGDYIENLRKTAIKIEEKVDLKQEISATIAEKQLELKVMMVMPAAIIGYVKLGSPEFLKPMYNNIGGVLAMSGCIAMYIAAMIIGRKIVDIEI